MTPVGAVVLNLGRRPDRLHRFLDRWDALDLGVPLTVHQATDERAVGTPGGPAWATYPQGSWGCWDTHIRALAGADGPVLILEDDVVFTPGFTHLLTDLDPPAGWDLVHLGGQHLCDPTPVAPGVVAPAWMVRTHAYLAARPQALARALAVHPTHVDFALDQLVLYRFAVAPWWVGQDDSPGDVTRRNPATVEFWQERAHA